MPPDWEKLKATQRMQDYIESHLTERITLSALAKSARYSPWYAARVFKECTGKPPFEYIRLRRLAMAALRVGQAQTRIVDVAFGFVWADDDAPRFQLAPLGYRGYIEGRPVRPLLAT